MLQQKDCLTPIIPEKQQKPAIENLQQLLHAAKSLPSFPKLVSSQGEEIELPESVYEALYQVVEAMASGTSITISPIDKAITIEESAKILNVSKDYIHKLIEQGDLKYTIVGTTKQFNCKDVLEYKQVRDSRRRESLDELTAFMQQEGFYD